MIHLPPLCISFFSHGPLGLLVIGREAPIGAALQRWGKTESQPHHLGWQIL